MYLVDSDRTINFLQGRRGAAELLVRLIPDGLAISVMTYAEVFEGLVYGRHPGSDESVWAGFLRVVEVLAHTVATAQQFAAIRGRLRADGMLIPDADIWIAATAMEHDLTLVTGNRRYFERVAGLRLLN